MAFVIGPYLEIIGHNGCGMDISDALQNLRLHLNDIGYSDVLLEEKLWD